jgi:hypothetical protein
MQVAQHPGADRPQRHSSQKLREVEPRGSDEAETKDWRHFPQVREQVRRTGINARYETAIFGQARTIWSILKSN